SLDEQQVEHYPTRRIHYLRPLDWAWSSAHRNRTVIGRHPFNRGTAGRRQLVQEFPFGEERCRPRPHEVSRDGVARKARAVDREYLAALAREEHGQGRARAAGPDDQHVVSAHTAFPSD